MRFVPIKTDDQLDLQGIHRVHDRRICRRTAVINQLRAFLLERGMVFAQRPAILEAAMADIMENAAAYPAPQMRSLINMLWDEWKLVEEQIKMLDVDLGTDLGRRCRMHADTSDPGDRTSCRHCHRCCHWQRRRLT